MSNVFYNDQFNQYVSFANLQKARMQLNEMYHTDNEGVTVFISHKHDDLSELKGIIGFLEYNYHVKAYIDCKDPRMPIETSGITAKTIKERIRQCQKFILLATEGAINSKWCNWELGYGDAIKYEDGNIAILPMMVRDRAEDTYRGMEYLEIYPHIVRRNDGDTYSDGSYIKPGYYIRYKEKGSWYLKELSNWLHNNELR